ncbi:MAG TPA: ABC transporter permease, partial [Gemmataceae bacterium]|nr:ABC transporter permease [Gemmataceae bacterium]
MRKVFVIAARDYNAAVRTKAFLIGLLIMPIMMGGSLLMQWLLQGFHDTKEKRFAVVDRTPGRKLLPVIEAAADLYNRTALFDDKGKQVEPRLVIEPVQPAGEADEAVDDLRERLSQRVRNGEIFGFLEVGPDALASAPSGDGPPDQRRAIRYQSNRPTYLTFPNLMRAVLTRAVQDERGQGAGLNPSQREAMMQPVAFESKGLSRRDPATGKVEDASKQSEIAPFAVPFGLMMLMFMVVLMGASPLMQGVVEEKMQRIAEVLLGSVRPFELMLGKLAGMVGVSLTVVAVYLTGSYLLAARSGYTEFMPGWLLAWFLVYQVLAVLMYGSIFIAIGAAVTDMKETQGLLMPVMVVAMLPLFVLIPIIEDPNSLFATLCSFFPPSTPMLMLARQAIPPGPPWWQPPLGIALVLATTLGCVYAAGRIFRVGILMQGKGA